VLVWSRKARSPLLLFLQPRKKTMNGEILLMVLGTFLFLNLFTALLGF
jgi:hypothetical protein